VVAIESIAQVGLLLLSRLPDPEVFLFLFLALWLCGGMLYVWMISLIFYRYTFFVVDPEDLKSSYWIDMGAMAIASVVGALLAESIDGSAFAGLAPFVRGITILFWSTATWWIPMLVILGVWRHFVRHVPFAYDALYWAAVFPLGMYAVATFELAKITGMTFLAVIAGCVLYIALAAWLLVMTGMLRAIFQGVEL
jgi:tellurite resistance protein TehA-like permease